MGTDWVNLGIVGSWESCTFGATKETSAEDGPRLDTGRNLPLQLLSNRGDACYWRQAQALSQLLPERGGQSDREASTDGEPASAGFVLSSVPGLLTCRLCNICKFLEGTFSISNCRIDLRSPGIMDSCYYY